MELKGLWLSFQYAKSLLQVMTRCWFTGPLHQPRQIPLNPYGHKPLMSLWRYVTIRYTTSPTVPLLWLTAVWWQSHLSYIIHSKCEQAHLPPWWIRWYPAREKKIHRWWRFMPGRSHTKSPRISKTHQNKDFSVIIINYHRGSIFFHHDSLYYEEINHGNIFCIYCSVLLYITDLNWSTWWCGL